MPFKLAISVCLPILATTFLFAESPMTKRIDHTDSYHGTEVADPYRWLEDDVRESDDVANWVKEQNESTDAFLDKISARDGIQKRLTELWNYEKFGTPFKRGGRMYFYKNDGLQNQFVLYTQESADAEPRVLLDPNTWSKDGTVALGGTSFSDDGRFLAYSIQDAGSDWRTWRIMNLATGELLDEELSWIKFNSPSWTPDGNGFFYGRFPEPVEGEAFQSTNTKQKIFYHKIGTPQSDDVLVYHRPDKPEWGYSCHVTDDGDYLIITVHVGTDNRYRILYKNLREPFGMPIDLVDNFDHEYGFIANDGPLFYFLTDHEAPRKRVVSIDIRKPGKEHHKELVSQQKEVMTDVNFVGNLFVIESLKDALTQVSMYRTDGAFVRNITFPGLGSARGFGGSRNDLETYYSYSSFDTPPSIYRYDIISGESKLIRQAKVDIDSENYTVKQVFYKSKDGTKIPMFIAHKKGIELNGNNPTLLYGYGGFNIPLSPGFSISRLAWMEMGGVFAMANLRGGGEYGEEWHQAGTKLQKQNVFDDFIAAAEWLIENKYTKTPKLAIQGGSNGGLLVGACMTQRPDLYGACLPAVGVMDMLRFHQFTAGRYWVDDYGSADDAEEFKALFAYSPYHNVKPDTCYPPTLVTTADTDDRVVPGHSFKFAAALQHAQSCDNPTLIRIETRAGHGSGKPTSKAIEEVTDIWSFLVEVLDMKVK